MKIYPQKAIVTGGAGFIGSHIVTKLVKMGVETISIDDYFAGKRENLAHLKSCDNFHEAICDVTDMNELEKYFDGVDTVFHEAASKKTICLSDPRRDLEINAEGTFNMLELSMKYGVRKFVHASTGSVYGEPVKFPQDENHRLHPVSYYGVSKLAGESYVKTFHHLYGLDTTVLRYFHVYGARQESSDVGGVVSIFVRKMLAGQPVTIFGDGTQQRSFTHVDDVVRTNIAAAISDKATGQVYNCVSGIKVTISELVEHLRKILGIKEQKINYEDWMVGDIKVFDVDNSKVKKDLDIVFMTNFVNGLKETVQWARENGYA